MISVHKRMACETVMPVISFESKTATRKDSTRYLGALPILKDYFYPDQEESGGV